MFRRSDGKWVCECGDVFTTIKEAVAHAHPMPLISKKIDSDITLVVVEPENKDG